MPRLELEIESFVESRNTFAFAAEVELSPPLSDEWSDVESAVTLTCNNVKVSVRWRA